MFRNVCAWKRNKKKYSKKTFHTWWTMHFRWKWYENQKINYELNLPKFNFKLGSYTLLIIQGKKAYCERILPKVPLLVRNKQQNSKTVKKFEFPKTYRRCLLAIQISMVMVSGCSSQRCGWNLLSPHLTWMDLTSHVHDENTVKVFCCLSKQVCTKFWCLS